MRTGNVPGRNRETSGAPVDFMSRARACIEYLHLSWGTGRPLRGTTGARSSDGSVRALRPRTGTAVGAAFAMGCFVTPTPGRRARASTCHRGAFISREAGQVLEPRRRRRPQHRGLRCTVNRADFLPALRAMSLTSIETDAVQPLTSDWPSGSRALCPRPFSHGALALPRSRSFSNGQRSNNLAGRRCGRLMCTEPRLCPRNDGVTILGCAQQSFIAHQLCATWRLVQEARSFRARSE